MFLKGDESHRDGGSTPIAETFSNYSVRILHESGKLQIFLVLRACDVLQDGNGLLVDSFVKAFKKVFAQHLYGLPVAFRYRSRHGVYLLLF